MAVVLDKSVSWGTIEEMVKKAAGPLLTSLQPFDIFESDSIGSGKKSVAFHMTFQSHDKTLIDQEINSLMDAVRQTLKNRCGADVR